MVSITTFTPLNTSVTASVPALTTTPAYLVTHLIIINLPTFLPFLQRQMVITKIVYLFIQLNRDSHFLLSEVEREKKNGEFIFKSKASGKIGEVENHDISSEKKEKGKIEKKINK